MNTTVSQERHTQYQGINWQGKPRFFQIYDSGPVYRGRSND